MDRSPGTTICDRLMRRSSRRIYGGRIEPGDTAFTTGCNMAFFATAMVLARHGDAVLLPTPWYFNYQMTLAMMGIEARPLPCLEEEGFAPRVEDAEKLIDGRVKAIVLVTPNNPTGAVYPEHVVAEFAALCRRKGIYLVIDETYRDFLPSGMSRPHGLFADEDWRDTVIGLYSFSKSYAIPGHRIGAVTAAPALIAQMAKVLDCLQICPPRPAQLVLPWAIENLREWREDNRVEINRRSSIFQAAMNPCREWDVESSGAYFAYLRHPFPAEHGASGCGEARGGAWRPLPAGQLFRSWPGQPPSRRLRQCRSRRADGTDRALPGLRDGGQGRMSTVGKRRSRIRQSGLREAVRDFSASGLGRCGPRLILSFPIKAPRTRCPRKTI